MAGLWTNPRGICFLGVLRTVKRIETSLVRGNGHKYFDNACDKLESRNLFNPSKAQLAKSDKLFEVLGPRAVLQGSAVKVEDAPKLQLPEVTNFIKKN